MLKIGFVRHGQTNWNSKGITQGQTDIPLNEAGIAQAKQLAARLQQDEQIWEAVISSPLSRAYDTATIVAEALHLPLLDPDKRVQERNFGLIEGTAEPERIERWGKDWRSRSEQYGVESDEDVFERGMSFLNDLRASDQYDNVLLVSHGSFIAVMLNQLCLELKDERLMNLSYSIVSWNEDVWIPLLYNCTRHLIEN